MKTALIIVDVQNDFCPGGALPVAGGDQVVPLLNEYAARFDRLGLPVFASRDWHPERTRHFAAFGGVWPPHCLQNTPGAEFHPDLRLPAGTLIVTKGDDPDEDAYSAFQAKRPGGKTLPALLRNLGVVHVFVGGLATDYCVRATALDARQAGLSCTLLVDATRGVDVRPGDTERALAEMVNAGVSVSALDSLVLE